MITTLYWRKQTEAFGMQVLVGDDVELLPDGFQPVDNVEVGVELPRRRTADADPRIRIAGRAY